MSGLKYSHRLQYPRETMSAYFNAMKEDLTITRYQTFSDLMHYMDGSTPVGRAVTYILGVRKPYTLEEAVLGLQIASDCHAAEQFSP
jgi:phytoene/squalene synthetase